MCCDVTVLVFSTFILITAIVLARRFLFTTINFKMIVDLTKLAFKNSFRLIARYTFLLDKLLNVLFSYSFGGTIGEVYDLWSLLRLFFGSREDR